MPDSTTTGAVQGASTGASMGPWGALAGAVVGGVMGSNAEGNIPNPVYMPSPVNQPSFSGTYGGYFVDPRTGSMVYQSNQAPTSSNELQNQMLMDSLMGRSTMGAGSQEQGTYDSTMQQLQSRLSALDSYATGRQGSGTVANQQEMERERGMLMQQMSSLRGSQGALGQNASQSNNPMMQFLNQDKFNNIANGINQNFNANRINTDQALASRGLSASSLNDMNDRQLEMQRATAIGNATQQVGQQDFGNRIGMLQYLQGANQSAQGIRMGQDQLGLGQAGLGANMGDYFANANNQANATNAGLTNSYNWAGFNQNQMNNARNQQQWSNVGSAMGATDWSKVFSPSNSSSPTSYSGGNMATNPTYNGGSSNALNPYGPGYTSPTGGLGFGMGTLNQQQFNKPMTAAGG